MPGTKGHSGGKRDGAGRKRRKPTISLELTLEATRELLHFVENLNLSPSQAGAMVSEMVLAALTEDYARWAETFGNATDADSPIVSATPPECSLPSA